MLFLNVRILRVGPIPAPRKSTSAARKGEVQAKVRSVLTAPQIPQHHPRDHPSDKQASTIGRPEIRVRTPTAVTVQLLQPMYVLTKTTVVQSLTSTPFLSKPFYSKVLASGLL